MPYIECHHCNKIIHNVSILKDITLNLDRNKIYGFIGHNGCGKTMLFKLLTGMISASGGEVFVNGERIDPAAPYPQKLGVMIENNGLWPYLSAYDNLAVLASIRKELNKEDLAPGWPGQYGKENFREIFTWYEAKADAGASYHGAARAFGSGRTYKRLG